jgi:hypothetical protein
MKPRTGGAGFHLVIRGPHSSEPCFLGGKIIVRGGSGQVDPDGTLHSVGAGNGMTLTAVGTPDLEHSIDPMAVSVAGSLSSGELCADAHYRSSQTAQASR